VQIGDLVRKRWGRIEPYQAGALAICIDNAFVTKGLFLTGALVKVVYPGRKPEVHKIGEFEVIE
jgi:hypothetical protein